MYIDRGDQPRVARRGLPRYQMASPASGAGVPLRYRVDLNDFNKGTHAAVFGQKVSILKRLIAFFGRQISYRTG